jgi:hypothetical protein
MLRFVPGSRAVDRLRLVILAPALVLAGNLAVMGQIPQRSPEEPSACAHAVPTATGSWSERWHAFWADTQLNCARSNAWPEPFQLPDRELVRCPLRTMADNGWREQNTFAGLFFDDDGHQLNHAGQEKLRYILTQLPPHRRQIFVLEGDSPQQTAARVASVYQVMAQWSPDGQMQPVFTTRLLPRYGSGGYQYGINRSYDASLPEPRLPVPSYPSIFAGGAATR